MSNQKPTEALKKDHKVIKDVIKVLELCACSLEEKGKCDSDILKGSMNLIKYFNHKYHRRMEEQVLFRIASKKAAPWGFVNIGSLIREHEEGAEQVRRLADILGDSVANGISNKKSQKAVIKNIYAYSSLLASHLLLEEKALYPVIESVLTNQEKKNILQSFDQLNQEMSEIGDKDRYSSIIKDYKKRLIV